MTGNQKLHNSQWTELHDAYCLENQITPSAKLLWQWLNRQGIGNEQEPDLAEFNQWVQKHRGKGYTRPTLKNALACLVNLGVVQLVKQFTWRIVRIITRPLDWLKPKKNYQNRHKNFTSQPSNDLSAEKGESSSSIDPLSEEQLLEMEAVLSECQQAGIIFDPVKSPEILEYTLEEVKRAIALFHERGGHETNWRGKRKIPNPQGWLITCLRKGWAYEPVGWTWGGLLAALGVEQP